MYRILNSYFRIGTNMAELYSMPIHFFRHVSFFNLGDELAPYILQKILKSRLKKVDPRENQSALFSVGSILSDACFETQTVWGSGLIAAQARPQVMPNILAVRGPLTARALQIDGKVPLGDPALILPDLYQPKSKIEKKFKLGVIPHYMDKNIFLNRFDPQGEKSVNILNVATNKVEEFIDRLIECEFIISSSLHGLIIAQAYNIPAVWVEFSDKIIGAGFKFFDFFYSVGIAPYKPPRFVNGKITFYELLNLEKVHKGQLYINNFDKADLYSAIKKITS